MFVTRSNYFAVRDTAAFRTYCERHGLQPITDARNPLLHGFLIPDGEMAQWDGQPPDLTDEPEDFDTGDYLHELPRHLADSHVAVVIQVGSDKTRFLFAHAWAFNSNGDVREADINSIYTLAQELGGTVTRAEY